MMRLYSVVARVLLLSPLIAFSSAAQVNVTTYHNDIARTGQNTQETILTPANVNSSQFGKLFSVTVDGYVYAQPLYLSGVTINGGTHNVLYVATEHDSLYAIDADSGTIYWQVSLIPSGGATLSTSGFCSDLVPEVGITGTPVIDSSTKTIYLVAKTSESGNVVQRLHAIDAVTHAEKFGGPKVISASVPGSGDGSSGTPPTVAFNPLLENQRPALLLENGHVIIGWGAHCDITPYHGWLMSYSASTLAQEAVFNADPNGSDSGIWMSGGGVAADASGNLFFSTGNGTYDGASKNDYGDTILKLSPPSGGSFAVADWFTPWDQASFATTDNDVSSGGLVLLPALANGNQYLALIGKVGVMYLVNRNNMGKFCSSCTSIDTQIVQEIPGATVGVWGSPAYWNNTVYWGGASNYNGPDNLKAFSFNANGSGLMSTSPTSKSSQLFSYAAPVPSISANGTSNGILWGLDNSTYLSACCQILYAFNATNLETMLYNSSQAANNRDVPGGAVKFNTPTIANGKVYVGSQGKISAFGLLSTTSTAATPTFSPLPGTFSSAQSVTLSDATTGATIYYTTNGTTPTTASTVYKSAIAVNATTTIEATAAATGYSNSTVASGTYTIASGGTGINYGSGFSSTGLILNGSSTINGTRLRLTDGGANEAASAYYSTAQNVQSFTNNFSFQLANPNADGMTFIIQNAGTTAISLSGGGLGYGSSSPSNGVVGIGKSVAVKFDLFNSAGEGSNSTGLYTDGGSPTIPAVTLGGGVNLHSGDVFNVHMTYDGTTLTMTITDASVPADTFTTSWTVNIPGAVGANTAWIGFTAATGSLTATQDIITWSFNPGTVTNPTAATPTFSPLPGTFSSAQSVTLSDTTTGATIYYTTNGTTPTTASTVYKSAIAVNATTTIEAMAAATGYSNSTVASGTYTIASGGTGINYGSGFSSTGLILNGSSTINGTRLRLTDGGANEAASAYYSTAQNVQSFTNNFSFQLANPNADGMTFIIQNAGTTAISLSGGGLGYGSSSPSNGVVGIGESVAVKFDLFNSAGEGSNSTGLYTDGGSPTIPAVTLGGGVNLHSGDVFNVHMTYDGTTLTMTITDASVPADTFTTSWTVNIPGAVGANTAWIGFTAATGSLTATQDIITWSYTH